MKPRVSSSIVTKEAAQHFPSPSSLPGQFSSVTTVSSVIRPCPVWNQALSIAVTYPHERIRTYANLDEIHELKNESGG